MGNVPRNLGSCVMVIMLAIYAYGFIRFPDSPIHPCPEHGYCGKLGQPHTEDEYVAFSHWQTLLFVVWPVGMLSFYLISRKRK